MLQPRQDNLLTRLLNLSGEEHFIEDRVDLYETPPALAIFLPSPPPFLTPTLIPTSSPLHLQAPDHTNIPYKN